MTLTPLQAAQQTAKPILEFGRAWMVDASTAAKARELGLADLGRFGFWVSGRAGVLGDVDSKIAAAAIGFMDPAEVDRYWQGRPAGLSAWQAALEWFGVGAEWGRTSLAAMDETRVRRLADLTQRVVEGADPSVGALFAGSTLIPLPSDAAGAATIGLNVLRELRGGAHLAACHAAGLGPHATIMSTDDPVRGGAPWAEGFGWQAPHPTPDLGARTRVEELTDQAAKRAFETLSTAECSEYVELVLEARSQLG